MRIGVIGLGTIGQTHLSALRHVGAQIFGADPSEAAQARSRQYTARSFADYRDLLSSADLDGVVIATPPQTHREIAVAALSGGLGVLCEKPMAVTLDDCEAIAASVREARGPFQVGFCHRFQPQVRALRGLLTSGALGPPLLVSISFVHGLTEEGREWITDPARAGGGVVFESGSHAIDLFRHLVGNVDDVRGLIARSPEHVEDTSVVALRSGQTLGTITLCWRAPPWQGLVEVIGSKGRARVDYAGDRVTLRTRLGSETWRYVRTHGGSRFVAQMQHFLACLRGEAQPGPTVSDGLEATRVVLRIYETAIR
jgi:predicted dehydrogenase